jgi:hypothetical protein
MVRTYPPLFHLNILWRPLIFGRGICLVRPPSGKASSAILSLRWIVQIDKQET